MYAVTTRTSRGKERRDKSGRKLSAWCIPSSVGSGKALCRVGLTNLKYTNVYCCHPKTKYIVSERMSTLKNSVSQPKSKISPSRRHKIHDISKHPSQAIEVPTPSIHQTPSNPILSKPINQNSEVRYKYNTLGKQKHSIIIHAAGVLEWQCKASNNSTSII
jgi:hypothetical protein